MERAGANNQAPNSGNQRQTRSSLHPQHQQVEAFPPYQESNDYDDYDEPVAFPPPPGKAHAFPPPQPDERPASFPPSEPQQLNNQHVQTFPQQTGFIGGNMNAGIGNNMGTSIHVGTPIDNPALQKMPMPIPVVFQPIGINTTQPWKSSLFDCFNDPENALITMCAPCVTFGQIAEIVDQGQTSCGQSGFYYSLIAFCIAMPCLFSCTYRGKMRGQFGLIESPGPDWIIHCFCECCALCQEYRELKQRGYDPSIGWAGNAAKMGMLNGGVAMMTPPMQPMMMGR